MRLRKAAAAGSRPSGRPERPRTRPPTRDRGGPGAVRSCARLHALPQLRPCRLHPPFVRL